MKNQYYYFLALAAVLQVGVGVENCPDIAGWDSIDYANRCFYFSDVNFTPLMKWATSRDTCVGMGGKLATIDSQIDYDLHSQFPSGIYWIGLSRPNNASQWEWVDGTTYSVTRWKVGHPSSESHALDWNCALQLDGGWGTLGCDWGTKTMCEVPYSQ